MTLPPDQRERLERREQRSAPQRIISRAAAGLEPPRSVTPLAPSRLRGVCVHYFGNPRLARDHRHCAARWRSVQQAHLANTAEGYVDIAYNHGVCPHGFIFEGRGFGVRAGANGTREANTTHAAVVYMGGRGDALTPEARHALIRLIEKWRVLGAGRDVRRHGQFVRTECPGEHVAAFLHDRYAVTLP